jgi:hypothetical protein
LLAAIQRLNAFIARIQDALDTTETGDKLVRLVRRARVAEKQFQDYEQDRIGRRRRRVMRAK